MNIKVRNAIITIGIIVAFPVVVTILSPEIDFPKISLAELIALKDLFFWAFVALLLYILPGVTASSRQHPNRSAIWALNLLLGWTALGWAIAFIWAFTGRPPVASPAAPASHNSTPDGKAARGLPLPLIKYANVIVILGIITALVVVSLIIGPSPQNPTYDVAPPVAADDTKSRLPVPAATEAAAAAAAAAAQTSVVKASQPMPAAPVVRKAIPVNTEAESECTSARLWAIDTAKDYYRVLSKGARKNITNFGDSPGLRNGLNEEAMRRYPKNKAKRTWFVAYAGAYINRVFELIEELHHGDGESMFKVLNEVRNLESSLGGQSPMASNVDQPLYNALYENPQIDEVDKRMDATAKSYRDSKKIKFAKDVKNYREQIFADCLKIAKDVYPEASGDWHSEFAAVLAGDISGMIVN